jgi:hypothetical protein
LGEDEERRYGEMEASVTTREYTEPEPRFTRRPKRRGINWKSRASLFGVPLVHVAFGRDAHGRIRVAKGFIAIGRFAVGAITFAQFGVGIIFGFGQVVLGIATIGQVSVGLLVAVGQIAAGTVAIGQAAVGLYAVGQVGLGTYVWTPRRCDMEAVALLDTVCLRVMQLLGMR